MSQKTNSESILLLLTCGTNACYHIAKRIKECFGDRIQIVGADINKKWMIPTSPFLDSYIQVPLSSDSSYYKTILGICEDERVNYIMPSFENLKNTDSDVYQAIEKELKRQQNKIELIASENFVSNSVMEAMRKLFNK